MLQAFTLWLCAPSQWIAGFRDGRQSCLLNIHLILRAVSVSLLPVKDSPRKDTCFSWDPSITQPLKLQENSWEDIWNASTLRTNTEKYRKRDFPVEILGSFVNMKKCLTIGDTRFPQFCVRPEEGGGGEGGVILSLFPEEFQRYLLSRL